MTGPVVPDPEAVDLRGEVAEVVTPPQPVRRLAVVWVYGTLRRGEANAKVLAGSGAIHDRDVRSADGWRILDLGAFPGLVPGGEGSVAGEVYLVDAPTLARLDRIEGVPTLYRRAPIDLADGRLAWAYVLASPGRWGDPREVPGGDWTARGPGVARG